MSMVNEEYTLPSEHNEEDDSDGASLPLEPNPQEIQDERESIRRMSHLITPPRHRMDAVSPDAEDNKPVFARRGSSFLLERNDNALSKLRDVALTSTEDCEHEEKKVNDDVRALVTPSRGRRFFKARQEVVSVPWNQIKRGSVLGGEVALFYDDHVLPRPPSLKLSAAAAAATAATVESEEADDQHR